MRTQNDPPCGALPPTPALGGGKTFDSFVNARSSLIALALAAGVLAASCSGAGTDDPLSNLARGGESGASGTSAQGGSSGSESVPDGGNLGGSAGGTGTVSVGGNASAGVGNAGGGNTGGGSGENGSGGIGNGGSAAGSSGAGEKAGGGSAGNGGAAGKNGGDAGATSAGGANMGVKLDGPRITVGGRAFHIRGVCWNPVPKGKSHPAGLDFAGAADRDIALMKQARVNVVRTYEPLTNLTVLDKLAAAGIYVLDSVYPYGGDAASVVTARVTPIRNHPAILMWLIGNEWNYNGLYVDLPQDQSIARLNEVATLLRAADPTHPIATVYGEVPTAQTIAALPNVDVWGINAYRGITFGDLFAVWSSRSQKPMFLAEYGADAYNATSNEYDPDSQAMAVRALTQELASHGAAFEPTGVTLGGAVFEWADEWWKDSAGSVDVHEVGGIAPGGGPYPDQTFNEEWFGLVDIDRQPRPAYDALKAVFDTLPN